MAIISIIGGQEPSKSGALETQKVDYDIYFGVFFDGTSNNMIQGSTARKIRSNHAKSGKEGLKKMMSYGWVGDNRHKYENELTEDKELKSIEDAISEGSFKEKGFSNIAILFSKYKGVKISDNDKTKNTIVYKIYVEGSGSNDIKEWKTGIGTKGLGFGLSKTSVVALVSKAVSAVDSRLKFFNSYDGGRVSLHFDVFGFSRGAACARLFSYLVKREKTDILGKREKEFNKYYCKNLYGKGSTKDRLAFLDDYHYISSSKKNEKTKEVSFLGIFDTVVSIGMLRRKKEVSQTEKDSNQFIGGNNVINPLRAGFCFDRDFDENLHDLNVAEYGMYSPQLGVPTFHICAMDEFRENFALTDVGKDVPANSLEIFIPGCHSDIGGGYICNNEEKIVLNKYPTFSFEGLPFIKPEEGCAQLYTDNPQYKSGTFEPLNLDTVSKLGWLPKDNKNIEEQLRKNWVNEIPLHHNKATVDFPNTHQVLDHNHSYVQGKKDNTEGNAGQYEWWDRGDKIGWIRTVPSFFSNVPLHLMAERASIITKRCLFTDGSEYIPNKFWERGYYEIPKGLCEFYEYVRGKVINSKGGYREWVFPDGGSYSSEKYRNLRLHYLHFTSEQKFGSSRIWDIQNATNIQNANNNKRYYNVISRIIYHGDKEDKGKMHYMFDYNT